MSEVSLQDRRHALSKAAKRLEQCSARWLDERAARRVTQDLDEELSQAASEYRKAASLVAASVERGLRSAR